MAKGSRPRPFAIPFKEFDQSFDTIFGKKEPKPRWTPPPLPGEDMQVRVKEDTSKIGQCGCGRSPTGKCIGWHGLTEEAFVERKELYETGKVDLSGKEIK
jgi:hypothetical protein